MKNDLFHKSGVVNSNVQKQEWSNRKRGPKQTQTRKQKQDTLSRPHLSKTAKTYNTTDSLVVTDPTTSAAVRGLSKGERTGSRAFLCIWSYVIAGRVNSIYVRELGVVGGFWLTGVCTKHGKRYGVRIGGSTSMLTSVQQPTNYPMGNSYSCR